MTSRENYRCRRIVIRIVLALAVIPGLGTALAGSPARAAVTYPAVASSQASASSAAQPAGWRAVTAAKAPEAAVSYIGGRILDKAETKVNHFYGWGGTGPSVFDCSGLVYWAAGAAGEHGWPRDTFDIAAQIGRRFIITSHPVRGDLALWGSVGAPYHVEIVTAWRNVNFGAETYGWRGRVTWHSSAWFRPSFFLRIRW